jgi:SPOR domain
MTGARSASVFGYILALAIMVFATTPAGAASNGDKTALEQVRVGYAELKKKRYDAAIKEFSSALTTGKLTRNEMAKALYYRGVAYRKTKQATKAITDFSRALWLKGALSKTEREDAEKQRTAAYAEAGGSSAAPVIDSPAAAPPKATAKVAARGKRTATAKPRPAPPQTSAGAWRTSTEPTATSSRTPQRQARSENSVSSFFSNLFGGGNSAKSNLTPPPRTTASVPQVSAWSSETSPSQQASGGFRTKTRRTRPARRAGTGRYMIQVAILRSQREADNVAKRLSARHGSVLGGRQPMVEKRTVGNMGALYHVRVAGFRSPAAAGPVCKTLRKDGLDCLVQKRGR